MLPNSDFRKAIVEKKRIVEEENAFLHLIAPFSILFYSYISLRPIQNVKESHLYVKLILYEKQFNNIPFSE